MTQHSMPWSVSAPRARSPFAFALALAVLLLAPAAHARPQADADAGREHAEPQPPAAVSHELPVLVTHTAAETGPAPFVFSCFHAYEGGGPGALDSYPPDPHGAIGPHGILSVFNRGILYTSKNGTAYAPQYPQGFTAFFPSHLAAVDPHALFDRRSRRFFVTAMVETPAGSELDIAVSRTDDPQTSDSTSWWFYAVNTTETDSAGVIYAADYPSTGVDSLAFYVSCNVLSVPLTNNSHFRHVRLYILPLAAVLNGTLAVKYVEATGDLLQEFTLQPVTVYPGGNPGNVAYFAEVPFISTTTVRLWAVSDPVGTPALSVATLDVPNHAGTPEDAPQCGKDFISTFAPRAQGNAFWKDGTLWFCHTGGGPTYGAVVFYYRIATNGFPAGTPTLAESGDIDGGGDIQSYQPAIGGNDLGDVGLVFTQSSWTLCPRMMVTARRAGATGFPPPLVAAASTGAYVADDTSSVSAGARWGDFASVSADPVDQTLWMTHELARPTGTRNTWYVNWASVQFPDTAAAWPATGRALRASTTPVLSPAAVSDRAGGAIVAWIDERAQPWEDLRAMRVRGSGALASGWAGGGVALGHVAASPPAFALAADSAGGAYLLWSSSAPAAVLLQHLGADGAVVAGWPDSGLVVDTGQASSVQLVTDPAGAALATWAANGASSGVRVQRVSASGVAQWPARGVVIAASGTSPGVASDDSAGAIVAWLPGPRAQRVALNGALRWGASGTALAPSAQSVALVSDGAGGALAVMRRIVASQSDLYAVRVTAAGALAAGWPAGGVALALGSAAQTNVRAVADTRGGALVAWTDARNAATSGLDVYAARVTAAGAVASGWPATGRAVCAASGDQTAPALAADGAGGVLVAWQDARGADDDAYFARVRWDGAPGPELPANGSALSTTAGEQTAPALVFAGSGAAIAAWADGRLEPACDPGTGCGLAIYAQRATFGSDPPAGVADTPPLATLWLGVPRPNPANRASTIEFDLPREERVRLAIYSIAGQCVRVLADAAFTAGPHALEWNGLDDRGRAVASGVYFCVLRADGGEARRKLVLVR